MAGWHQSVEVPGILALKVWLLSAILLLQTILEFQMMIFRI